MSTKRLLKTTLSLFANKILNKRVPFQIHLRVTDRCNLRCSYCFANYPNRLFNEPSLDQVITLLKELKKAGTARITITGGEPLIRDDIMEIVKAANELNFLISLTTNGI